MADIRNPRAGLAADRPPLGRYWLANLRLMAGLLLVWAGVGLGCGVLFADRRDALASRSAAFRSSSRSTTGWR
jgi:uncharacterized membrane protein